MGKYRYAALAAAGALLLAAPASAALASTQRLAPVLVVGKISGPAVKNGAKISAGLARNQKVHMTIGSFSATCTKSTFTAKVVKNPVSAGKASLSVTGQTLSSCKLNTSLATLKSITAINTPWAGTVTAKNVLTIRGAKTSRPVGVKAVISALGQTFTCIYTAPSASGKTANRFNTVTFTNQKLKLNASASGSLCTGAGATTATFSAVYGPVRDISVAKHPKVFVK